MSPSITPNDLFPAWFEKHFKTVKDEKRIAQESVRFNTLKLIISFLKETDGKIAVAADMKKKLEPQDYTLDGCLKELVMDPQKSRKADMRHIFHFWKLFFDDVLKLLPKIELTSEDKKNKIPTLRELTQKSVSSVDGGVKPRIDDDRFRQNM